MKELSKKVVFIADCLITQNAGIHFYAHQFISKVISQFPHNQYFIILPHPYGKLNATEIIVPISKHLPLNYRWRYFHHIPKEVNEINADIVIEMAHFGPFKIKKGKTATVIHDLTPILNSKYHGILSQWAHKYFLPKIVHSSDHLFVNSNYTRSKLIDYFNVDPDKIIIVYPGIKRGYTSIKKNTERRKYLLSVGTIEPRKNYTTLIEAFENIAALDSEIELKIAGGYGWKNSAFLNRVKKSKFKNRIHLLGYVEENELIKLYQECLIYVSTSKEEGFGMPILEAMHFGCPILASNIEVSKEIGGSAILTFEPHSSVHLSQLVSDWLENNEERKKYGLLAENRAKKIQMQKPNWSILFNE